ncbi:MAG: hypothetical protein DI539_27075 [Flavobacterium psychrophilum]|nr:MAG: hypothetical protein DI539_27075 [Flavobacterium psychrophilum]
MISTTKHLLLLMMAGMNLPAKAQQLHYTAAESEAIHDSIQQSRWDIGGRLSHYSFRYMSEFFPTGIINKPASPYLFAITPNKKMESLTIKSGAASLSLEDYLKKLHIASFIVVHKGTIVYERYFTMLPQDQHTLQSVTKVITSAIITSLINQGKIDIQHPIEKYLPELKGSDWQGITVKDILHMRSGMDIRSIDFETGPFTNPQHKNYQLESALGILPKAPNTPASVYKYIAGLKKDTLPGLGAAYSNINTFVLGWMAEKISGKKYTDLVSEMIWQPMGASANAYVCLSDKGLPWTHGSLSATLRDLARFGMLFTKKEMTANKEKLISFAQLKEIFDAPPVKNPIAPFKWVYQWDLASDGMMVKGGFGGQALYVDPENEVVIAYFNYVDTDWGINNMISDNAVNEIRKLLSANK